MRVHTIAGRTLGKFSLIFGLASLILATAATAAESPTNNVENSVVKIFSALVYPDPYKPWTKRSASEVSGSGVVIGGNRILTSAHVVLYASQVQVQANDGAEKYSANVEVIAPEMDLAVLKLDDAKFFEAHKPLQFLNVLPETKDSVMAYGYPEGGSSLSITKGIVSRIEYAHYNSSAWGLRIQIDAAINPGNSGGPAVVGDKIIGLAFGRLDNAQNIGYIIPTEEIELFLKDIADGHYDGKPQADIVTMPLENSGLRAYLKVDGSVEGVVVLKASKENVSSPLKKWDVITRIGDTPVDNAGMMKLRKNLRVHISYPFPKLVKNGKVPATILREGKELSIELPLWTDHPKVIKSLNGAYPDYFIYGPLVFSTLSREAVSGLLSSKEWLAGLIAGQSPLLKPLFGQQGIKLGPIADRPIPAAVIAALKNLPRATKTNHKP